MACHTVCDACLQFGWSVGVQVLASLASFWVKYRVFTKRSVHVPLGSTTASMSSFQVSVNHVGRVALNAHLFCSMFMFPRYPGCGCLADRACELSAVCV